MVLFKQLGLSEPILKALSDLGFESPTEIQQQAIPLLLDGSSDFIGLAQTGTGKTAAFGLPLLENLNPTLAATQALVLAPTRELGQQIASQLELFSKFLPKINVLAVYGGANIMNQINALRSAPQHIIIATPGRLIDLLDRKAIKLNQVKTLVLDEADVMLDMGFQDELENILQHTPEDKNTWLFSATMPDNIRSIVKRYMDNPVQAKAKSGEVVNTNIEHQYAEVNVPDKPEALMRFLELHPDMRGIVFCRTKRDTQDLSEKLISHGYRADALHGDLSQAQRDRVMRIFKKHDLQVLIATDVAARGIDVQDLTHVFHFSLPDDLAYYTHRSGRTARAGKKGVSIAFVRKSDRYLIQRIERTLGINFAKVLVPKAEDITSLRIEKWCKTLLEQKTKGKVAPELMEQTEVLFSALSKEELLAKVLAHEMEKIKVSSGRDLNDNFAAKPRDNKKEVPPAKGKLPFAEKWSKKPRQPKRWEVKR